MRIFFFYDMPMRYSPLWFLVSLSLTSQEKLQKNPEKIILFSKEFHCFYIQSRTN